MSNPYRLLKRGRGYVWTREAAVQSVRDFVARTGRQPKMTDADEAPIGTLVKKQAAIDLFGGWRPLLEEAGTQNGHAAEPVPPPETQPDPLAWITEAREAAIAKGLLPA